MPVDLTVRLTRADQNRNPYFYVPFDVPAGTTRIDVTMAYRHTEECIIDLGCLDPRITDYPSTQGFRGWSGGARDRFFIATDDATPGYIHGPIPEGRWQVILGLYKVPPAGADVRLEIALDRASRPTTPPPARTFPVRKGAGWYRGDLHCHTFHSDARGAPEVLHAAARQAGLDFLAVADHNTISQRRYFHPHSSPDLVFVRAMEVTTAVGHANVFGVDDWIDFRMTRPSDAHILERLVHERGGLLSVNHDKPTIPWDYELPRIDCMEVWQSTWMAWNWVSLGRWQQRLASGLRIAAIGGSDFHQPEALQPEGPLVLARPTTVLWMSDLSEDNVLAAMRAGRGYVTESPSGPHLEIEVKGAAMGEQTSQADTLRAQVRGAKGDRLSVIDARGPLTEIEVESDDWSADIRLDRMVTGFVRAEIVAVSSRPRLVAEFAAEFAGRPLPWDLTEDRLRNEPIRRAISNPVYVS
ncbi:MAG TPA: CehA/McbA family metallohydrolase [Devosia sp.]|nr:CehA/McbA family metallohydrolase [Devosia sp.]